MYWSHSFFADLIRPDGVVFDFGVNNGGFARLVAPSCRRVIGFEPDPTWGGRLSLPPNVLVVPKAVASKSGTIPFHVNEGLCSSLHFAEAGTKTVEVEAVTLSDAMAIEPEGRIDLIKMDIEGEELAILNSAPADLFTRVVQMTVEFHDFLDPASVPAIRAVIARMEGMGFHAIRFSWNSYGDLLFINQRLVPLTMRQRAWVRLRHKYVRGAVRVMRRMLIL
jgi:FkbM family methyltransferase